MTFQILASLFLSAAIALVALRPFSLALLKSGLLVVLMLALYFVWRPDDLTSVANVLGIGRGADLVSYVSSLTLLLVILSTAGHARRVDRNLTLLCRHVAIMEAQAPAEGASSSKG